MKIIHFDIMPPPTSADRRQFDARRGLAIKPSSGVVLLPEFCAMMIPRVDVGCKVEFKPVRIPALCEMELVAWHSIRDLGI